jgi:hypothetical protein
LVNKKNDKDWSIKVDSHDIDKLKEINMSIGTAEELKLTYKFEWEKKLSHPRVEIDHFEGSAVRN